MKTTLKIYPNKAKKSSKNYKIPFYLRVIHKGKKSEARLNVSDVTETYLNCWSQGVQRFNYDLSLNDENIKLLNKYFQSIEDKFARILNSGEYLKCPKTIRDRLIERGDESNIKGSKSFYLTLNNYFEKTILRSSELKEGTKNNKKKALNHLLNFLKQKNISDIAIDEFDVSQAHDFLVYLTSNSDNRIGMKQISAKAIVKDLKAIVNPLINRGDLKTNPFLSLKFRINHKQPHTLTEQDFNLIQNLNCDNRLGVYKNLFLLMCYTGLSYADLKGLETTTLNNGELLIQRQKTSVITHQYIPKQAIEILKEFSKQTECNITNTVIPKRSLDKVNLNLKLIAVKCGIEHSLSTKYARRFYRRSLNKAGILEPSIVKTLMGHTRHNDIDKHYFEISNEMLLEARGKIELYLRSIDNQIKK